MGRAQTRGRDLAAAAHSQKGTTRKVPRQLQQQQQRASGLPARCRRELSLCNNQPMRHCCYERQVSQHGRRRQRWLPIQPRLAGARVAAAARLLLLLGHLLPGCLLPEAAC
jgi:hypothetical protein